MNKNPVFFLHSNMNFRIDFFFQQILRQILACAFKKSFNRWRPSKADGNFGFPGLCSVLYLGFTLKFTFIYVRAKAPSPKKLKALSL